VTEKADGVPQIAAERVERRQAASIANAFFDRLDAAQLQQRLPSRFVGGHAEPYVVVDVELQVSGELVGEVTVVL
jgi:hypothetical protein